MRICQTFQNSYVVPSSWKTTVDTVSRFTLYSRSILCYYCFRKGNLWGLFGYCLSMLVIKVFFMEFSSSCSFYLHFSVLWVQCLHSRAWRFCDSGGNINLAISSHGKIQRKTTWLGRSRVFICIICNIYEEELTSSKRSLRPWSHRKCLNVRRCTAFFVEAFVLLHSHRRTVMLPAFYLESNVFQLWQSSKINAWFAR